MSIDLYTWPTPNGHKIHILLEELGLDYTVHAIDIGAGDQFQPHFLDISPNNRIPALVDSDGPEGAPISVFESGAILTYLAEKHNQFLPKEGAGRYKALEWLNWQMGGLGPMLGQAHHFLQYAPVDVPYGKERYGNEANRLYGVMDRKLAKSQYLGGDDYSIADMAAWPWTRTPDRQNVDRNDYPNFVRWFDQIASRPAVQKAVTVLADRRKPITDEKARDILFGATQFQKR